MDPLKNNHSSFKIAFLKPESRLWEEASQKTRRFGNGPSFPLLDLEYSVATLTYNALAQQAAKELIGI